MAVLWYATDVSQFVIGDTVNITDSDSLDNQVSGTDYTDQITEVTISGGEGDLDALNLLGTNQKVDESRPGLVECELSLIYQGQNTAELYYSTTTSTTGSFTRTDGADETGSRPEKSLLLVLKDSSTTNQVNIVMNNAKATGRGEISQSADGHAELSMTFSCKVADYYEEDNF